MKSILSHAAAVAVGIILTVGAEAGYLLAHVEVDVRPTVAASDLPSFAKPSGVAKEIAAELAPPFQRAASTRDAKAAVVACGNGFLERGAIKAAYPVGVRMIPPVTEMGIDATLTKFGAMKIDDIAKYLVGHAKEKGVDGGVHWSVWAAAERTRDVGRPPTH